MDKYNFRVIQKAIIFYKDRILLIQRSSNDEYNPDKWDLPGGKIEHGETPEKALLREIMEETGIEANNPLPMFAWSFNNFSIDSFAVIYQTKATSDKVVISSEHRNHKWVEKKDLGN
jgi:8-oxo-dGTP diphosphatase